VRVWAIAWSFAIAVAVELTGMHVLSDVVGGVVAGAALAATVNLLTQRQRRLDLEQQLCALAWEQHPDRAILLEFRDKRDATGQGMWMEVTRPDPTDPAFTNLWLQPVPMGKPVLIGSWRTPAD
jgi:hypothetical protein